MDKTSTVRPAIGSGISVDVPMLPISLALINPTYWFPPSRHLPSANFVLSLFRFNFSPPRSVSIMEYTAPCPFRRIAHGALKSLFFLKKRFSYRLCLFEFPRIAWSYWLPFCLFFFADRRISFFETKCMLCFKYVQSFCFENLVFHTSTHYDGVFHHIFRKISHCDCVSLYFLTADI